ncbi:tripartite tricarboxylate transporter substrate binding protein [Ramlibacter solisilvae]|uniref:ABC transporter substrate-binding protein n=1 Tax=Ramlibacter tataouinensis TaxID=94132 RepID=A0A127JX67_9BURK|nr:tripartite tricarboxylate transporter substrate binding protein [Ramlibacter tataouinensis]AMO24511.1 ABC transporter substrate-binding protein [Ramlibacter tataouinensis]
MAIHHSRNTLSRRAVLALAAAGALASAPAWAQSAFPNKPIRIVAAGAPGGGMDILARLIGDRMQHSLKQPVVIENKPGGNGSIAANTVLNAPPDGHTLLMTAASFTVMAQAMPKKPAYDVTKDLAPVAQIGSGGVFLVVSPDFPAKDMKELVNLVKSQPNRHNYATFGIGSSGHLVMAAIEKQTGMEINHIPYKAMQQIFGDVMNGSVKIAFVDVTSSLPLIKAGKIRALAVSGSARMPASPEVPTMTEQGFKFDTDGWFAMFAPKGTPAAVANLLNREIANALAAPELQARLLQFNMANPPRKTPEQFAQTIRDDLKVWTKIVQDNKITPED